MSKPTVVIPSRETGWSSWPITAMSCGTVSPSNDSAVIRFAAISSLWHMTTEGRVSRSRSDSMSGVKSNRLGLIVNRTGGLISAPARVSMNPSQRCAATAATWASSWKA